MLDLNKKYFVVRTVINAAVTKEPVGYLIQTDDQIEEVYAADLISFIKAGGIVDGVEVISRRNPLGISVLILRSSVKGISLLDKDMKENLFYLQKLTSQKKIDYNNKLQTKFTVVN